MKKKLTSEDNSKKRKRQKTSAVDNATNDIPNAEVLDLKNLSEGMVLLGCVIEVRQNCLQVSLSGCLVGIVPSGNISQKYRELIMNSDEDSDEEESDVADLASFVKVGSLYPCKVLSVTTKVNQKRPTILLSIDPQVVNSALRLELLYFKMVLHAAVHSVEDRGYIMDIGVPNVQGFLPFSACSDNKSLFLGQVMPVSVRKLPSSKRGGNVVWLSRFSHNDAYPEIDDESMNIGSILPGTNVVAYITEVKQPFIYMKCMNFNACANTMSLGSSYQSLNEAIKVTGTVLYIDPVCRMIYLHLGPKPTPDNFSKFFRVNKFDLVKNAKFEFFLNHRLLFRINKGALGLIRRELPHKGILCQEALAKNPVIPKARVVFLHYMDNLVQLSINDSFVNMEVIKPEEVQIGDIYECTVSGHSANGVFVSVCPGFGGFVRSLHLSDSLVTMHEKLFPIGAKSKCRVLSVHDSHTYKMTTKESLISIPQADILMNYDQAEKGISYKGVIVQKAITHLLVLFFNDVKGLVPTEEIPASSVLFVGQTVSCRVLHCDPSRKKLKLSLKAATHVVKSPGANVLKDSEEVEYDPRKKQKAIIQSITGRQLNIVLGDKKRGRVHVSEIDNAEEGYKPLKDFKNFQRIEVHVLGHCQRKSRNFLEISHRRKVSFLECSMEFPPPAPLQREYFSGMEVTGYVHEASYTSCILWLSPIQTATLDYLHISDSPKVVRKLKKQLKSGVAVHAKVLDVESKSKDKDNYYDITLTKLEKDQLVEAGHNVLGLVQLACPEKGLVLRLPHGYHGQVSLCDLQDSCTSVVKVLDKYRKMLYVRCHVLEINSTTKFCTLSLRMSRLYGGKSQAAIQKSDILPELTERDLKEGIHVKGFVKVSLSNYLIVNFGRMLDGKVLLHKCKTTNCTFCTHTKQVLQKYQPGEVIEVKVDSTKTLKGLYPLSLQEMDDL